MDIQKNQQKQSSAQEARQTTKNAHQSTRTQAAKTKMRFINKRNSQQPTVTKIEAKRPENGRQQVQAVLRPQVIVNKQAKAVKMAGDPSKQ